MRNLATVALIGVLGVSVLSACTWTPRTKSAAVVGGTAGAAVGALTTHTAGGAVIGAGVGAATGYVLANNFYRCQKVNMRGQPYWGWCVK